MKTLAEKLRLEAEKRGFNQEQMEAFVKAGVEWWEKIGGRSTRPSAYDSSSRFSSDR